MLTERSYAYGRLFPAGRPAINDMTRRLILTLTLMAMPLLSGPPLVCRRIEIGNARSLPWTAAEGWNGADSRYEVARLTADTLTLLAPETSVPVRMETMRRAAIYAAKRTGLAQEIAARLTARALDAEAAGQSDPLAWFDAGYWVETVRQASFIYRYDMLEGQEKPRWQIRAGLAGLDGEPWIRRAIALKGQGMAEALGDIAEYREADRRGRTAGSDE